LKNEVLQLLEEHAGRMELKQMPAHLGVDIEAIQGTIA